MRAVLSRVLVGVACALLVALLWQRGVFERYELDLYDLRLQRGGGLPADVPLAVIGITESFPSVIGEPFSRKHVARMLRLLSREGASLVASDIFFQERRDPATDADLIRAIRENGRVILPVYSVTELALGPDYTWHSERMSGSAPQFSSAARALAHINLLPDSDQVSRRIPLGVTYAAGGRSVTFPHMAVEAARLYDREQGLAGELKRNPLVRWGIASPFERGAFYIHYLPPEALKQYFYRFEDVLTGACPAGVFRGKVVLLGQTMHGQQNSDLVSTPFGIRFGALVQASGVWTTLTGRYIARVQPAWLTVGLLAAGIVLSLLLFSPVNWLNFLVFGAFSGAIFLFGLAAFSRWGLFVDMVPFLVMGAVCYVGSLTVSLRHAIRRVFQKESALAVLEGVEKELTTMLKPSEFFGGGLAAGFGGIESQELLRQTPEVALRTLLASLGISSGCMVMCPAGEPRQVIAASGDAWKAFNIGRIAQALEQRRGAPLILPRVSPGPDGFASSRDVRNMLACSILRQPNFSILGIFANKTPTPFSSAGVFSLDDARLAETLSLQALVAIQNSRLSLALQEAQQDTIFRLAVAIEYRDRETGTHIQRVSEYAAMIARNLDFPAAEVALIRNAMPMHDIGKIAIPDNILLKPGRLTDEERRAMQNHTTIGAKMLEGSSSLVLQAARIIALYHQERYDGTGYPYGLKGNAIPVYGRIGALADVFDALTSKRVYKEELDFQSSLQTIQEVSGTQLDPRVVVAFLKDPAELARIHFASHEREAQERKKLEAEERKAGRGA